MFYILQGDTDVEHLLSLSVHSSYLYGSIYESSDHLGPSGHVRQTGKYPAVTLKVTQAGTPLQLALL